MDGREKHDQDELDPKDGKKPKQAGGTGMYKSEFLHRKIAEQAEKKKLERLAIKANRQAGKQQEKEEKKETKPAKTNKKKEQPPTEAEERLMEIIAELQNDLKIKDDEYTDQKKELLDMQAENELLKQ